MALEFRLPDVGEGIDAGEIVEWQVEVGQDVVEDQPLADVQTDKAIVTIPCPTDGVVLRLAAAEGEMVPVGEVLAVFGDRSELGSEPRTADAGARAPAVETDPSTASTPASAAEEGVERAPSAPPAFGPASAARPLAAPAVRKLARDEGIPLDSLQGSGPGSRILREDVMAAAGAATDGEGGSVNGSGATDPVRSEAGRGDEVVPLRGIRRAIARNLTRSWQEIPHIIDYREADATRLLETRRAIKAGAEARGEAELAAAMTVLPLVAKIAATVACRHPRANASIDFEAEQITLHGSVNLSIAIDAPDGLLTPVVHDATSKSVSEIAREIATLAVAARDRSLTPEQLAGGTLTVNNFGAIGSPQSTPIIPPGQVINLGLGRIQEKPVARRGAVVIRPILGISCSGDHRVLDGADLTRFVNDIVTALENPALLLAELS